MASKRRGARPKIPKRPGYLRALQESATANREHLRSQGVEVTTRGKGCRCVRMRDTDVVLHVSPACPLHGDPDNSPVGPCAA